MEIFQTGNCESEKLCFKPFRESDSTNPPINSEINREILENWNSNKEAENPHFSDFTYFNDSYKNNLGRDYLYDINDIFYEKYTTI